MSTLRAWVCVVAIVAGASAAEAASLQFEQSTEVQGRVIRSEVKVHDEAFRIDMLAEGMKVSMIRNRDGLFNILHDQGMAMKIPDSQDNDDFALMRHVQDFNAYLQSESAEKIGEEGLDGRACDIYRIPSNGSKVWVSQELQFPLRVEVEGQVVAFSNIRRGVDFDPGEFSLPEGLQIMDLEGVDMNQAFEAGAIGD